MADIISTPKQFEFFSLNTSKGNARKARRDSRALIRDYYKLLNLKHKEEEASQKGSIGNISKSLRGIEKMIRDSFNRALDVIRKEDILQFRELNILNQNFAKLRNNPEQARQLKTEVRAIRDFVLKQVQMMERLRNETKPLVIQAGMDNAAVLRDIKRSNLDVKRAIGSANREKKKLGDIIKLHGDVISEVKKFVSDIIREENNINQALIDDFIEIYYLLVEIRKEENKIKGYESKGFPKLLGDKIYSEFEALIQEFHHKMDEAYKMSQDLLNFATRMAA